MKDEDVKLKYTFLTDNNGKELYDKTQIYINELKEEYHVDYIIILSHLGDDSNNPTQYNSSYFIWQIYGIDAIIDGHTDKIYNKTCKDKNWNDVLLSQTGTKLSNRGVIKNGSNDKLTSEMIDKVPEPKEKGGPKIITRNNVDRWIDKERNNFIMNLQNSLSGELSIKYGYGDFDFIVSTDEIGDYHKFASGSEECTLEILIGDSMIYGGIGDIAIKSSGSIRSDLLKGDITLEIILKVILYTSEIIIEEINGQYILDILEFSKIGNEIIDINKKYNVSLGRFLAGVVMDIQCLINMKKLQLLPILIVSYLGTIYKKN